MGQGVNTDALRPDLLEGTMLVWVGRRGLPCVVASEEAWLLSGRASELEENKREYLSEGPGPAPAPPPSLSDSITALPALASH